MHNVPLLLPLEFLLWRTIPLPLGAKTPKHSSETSQIETWNTIFCQFLECQVPPHKAKATPQKRKAPLLKTFWRRFWWRSEAASNDNWIITTSNWMSWWILNDLLLRLVRALGLKDYIGSIYFYPMTHMIFPGGSVTPGSHRPNVWSIDSECKVKNWYRASQFYFRHFKNSNLFSKNLVFLAGFSWKFVTWFLAGF